MKTDSFPGTLAGIAEIRVSADTFRRYKEAKAKASALTKEADALRQEMGLPDTANLVSQLGLSAKNGKGEVVVKDLNLAVIGKIAVFWKDPYQVDGGYSSRVS